MDIFLLLLPYIIFLIFIFAVWYPFDRWLTRNIKRLDKEIAALKSETLPDINSLPPDNVHLIVPGTYVQIRRAPERFWVEVKEVVGDMVVGRVDNDLLHSDIHGYRDNDTIRFKVNEILKIMGK